MTLGNIIDSLETIFYNAIDFVGWTASWIGNHPLALLFALIPLVGLGVGMFKRLINVN